MTARIGDTVAAMFTALVKDAGTDTPPITNEDIERLKIELNRLQAIGPPPLRTPKGGDLEAQQTLVFGSYDYYHVTGTTSIEQFINRPAGTVIWLEFDGSLTLKNDSRYLILQDEKDFTTHAGDVLAFIRESDDSWREVNRQLADALPDDTYTDEEAIEAVASALTDSDDIEWNFDEKSLAITGWRVGEDSIFYMPSVVEGRLTLTAGTPATTANVTAATSITFENYKGNRISLFDGQNWKPIKFDPTTIQLGTLTSSKPYDLFAFASGSSLYFDAPLVWSTTTARATALTTKDGVLVKSGDPTKRYIGSFYTQTATTTEDSTSRRLLFNYYNRVPRSLYCIDTTNSWTYTTAAFQEANAASTDGTSRVAIMIGWSEDEVWASNEALSLNSTVNIARYVGVGVDSSTANSALVMINNKDLTANNDYRQSAYYHGYPGVGYHTLRRLEYSVATGTCTWYGDNGTSNLTQTGMTGMVLA